MVRLNSVMKKAVPMITVWNNTEMLIQQKYLFFCVYAIEKMMIQGYLFIHMVCINVSCARIYLIKINFFRHDSVDDIFNHHLLHLRIHS